MPHYDRSTGLLSLLCCLISVIDSKIGVPMRRDVLGLLFLALLVDAHYRLAVYPLHMIEGS